MNKFKETVFFLIQNLDCYFNSHVYITATFVIHIIILIIGVSKSSSKQLKWKPEIPSYPQICHLYIRS